MSGKLWKVYCYVTIRIRNCTVDKNKMCGFVTFENETSVQNIMAEAMLGTTVFEVDGVKVSVKPKIKKEKAEKQRVG